MRTESRKEEDGGLGADCPTQLLSPGLLMGQFCEVVLQKTQEPQAVRPKKGLFDWVDLRI